MQILPLFLNFALGEQAKRIDLESESTIFLSKLKINIFSSFELCHSLMWSVAIEGFNPHFNPSWYKVHQNPEYLFDPSSTNLIVWAGLMFPVSLESFAFQDFQGTRLCNMCCQAKSLRSNHGQLFAAADRFERPLCLHVESSRMKENLICHFQKVWPLHLKLETPL